jgi:hypothetical protein
MYSYWESGSVLQYCRLKLQARARGCKPYANLFSESNFVQNLSLCREVNRTRPNFQADHEYATRDAEIKGVANGKESNGALINGPKVPRNWYKGKDWRILKQREKEINIQNGESEWRKFRKYNFHHLHFSTRIVRIVKSKNTIGWPLIWKAWMRETEKAYWV